MAESGGGVLGTEQRAPSPSVRVSGGSAVNSPSGVRGEVPETLDFGAFWDLRNHVRTVS